MPTFKLPCGKILTGQAAVDAEKKQKKEEKEAKKAAEKKMLDARKSGDACGAAAAAAELSSSNAAARMSAADAAQADVLAEIRSGSSEYRYFRVMAADWESDEELIATYQTVNLAFHKAEDAPGPKEISLFLGVHCLTAEKVKEMFDAQHYVETLESFSAMVQRPHVLEVHPSLLKKNGKMAVDIPNGAMVAVKSVRNTAQRLAPKGGNGHRIMALQDVSINHSYICAVIPPEMEASCIA